MKDIETLKSRVSQEGLAFLTKTLPKLGKALWEGLETHCFSCPREFKRSHENKFVPAFMQVHFKRVFGFDGLLLDKPCIIAIKHIAQICFAAYKLELPYSKDEENNVIYAFLLTEKELEEWSHTGVFRYAISDPQRSIPNFTYDVFEGFNPLEIVPRHGPGAVAGGEQADEKWKFPSYYPSLDASYPYDQYFMVGGSEETEDRFSEIWETPEVPFGTAKVTLVPKDSRGPRLISSEPREFMWLQQGLGQSIVTWLEHICALTRGHINFTDQRINQRIALDSSKTGEYATIDLKDASDRVSRLLVHYSFSSKPWIRSCLEALRSAATRLPTSEVVTLEKYAPMGSALCFPVEAFIFFAILTCTLSSVLNVSPFEASRMVYVYGDDIIVPSRYATLCMDALELFGLKVNRSKSFYQGKFRESCGENAFDGVSITPLRLRKPFTSSRGDGAAYASYVSLANRLAERGYTGASDYLWKELERVYGKIPYGTKFSSFPCRIVPDANEAEILNVFQKRCRWNQQLQRFEYKVLTLSNEEHQTTLDGWPRLLRNLTSGHGERPDTYVLPRRTKIQRRWKAVY